jgi:shikimate kinase
MNIFLIGYMGSGKSSIGGKLSKMLDFNFIDFDNYIELKENNTISEIFKSKGEIYFRKAESKYLKEVLATTSNTIIALGGGTPCYGLNMNLITKDENSISMCLKASISSLSNRLFLEKEHRPLIAHIKERAELNEFIGKHLFERSFYYNQCDLTVVTNHKSIDEVVEKIILELF